MIIVLIKSLYEFCRLAHHYEQYTYPIQNTETRAIVANLKKELQKENLFLFGRFAEWEYYNMDVAIGAALELHDF